MIETYSLGFVIIDGKNYKNDIWIDLMGNVKNWKGGEGHLIKSEDLKEVAQEEPDFLVIGTGAYGAMRIAEEATKFLFCQKIKTIIIKTGEAIKEYNRLAQEGKKVSVLLHLTC